MRDSLYQLRAVTRAVEGMLPGITRVRSYYSPDSNGVVVRVWWRPLGGGTRTMEMTAPNDERMLDSIIRQTRTLVGSADSERVRVRA